MGILLCFTRFCLIDYLWDEVPASLYQERKHVAWALYVLASLDNVVVFESILLMYPLTTSMNFQSSSSVQSIFFSLTIVLHLISPATSTLPTDPELSILSSTIFYIILMPTTVILDDLRET